MKEVYIVFEIMNDFVLGVYTTELNAIDGIFDSLKESGEEGIAGFETAPVKDDFTIVKAPLDERIDSDGNINFHMKGEMIELKNYQDLKNRQIELNRETKIDEIFK